MSNLPVKHAQLGASSAHRWMNCPGSIQLASGLPSTSSPHARLGTAAHELAALGLQNGEVFSPVDDRSTFSVLQHEGLVFTVEGEEITVTAEMCLYVQEYIDVVTERLVEGAYFWIEKQFDLMDLDPPAAMYGTADAVIFDEPNGVLDIIDLKYGQGVVVEVLDNPQLMYYALGAMLAIEKDTPEFRGAIKTVRVTIVQPRAPHTDGSVRTVTMPYSEVLMFAVELLERAEATTKPNAPLVPGDWCRFCKAQAVCPALKAQAQELAQMDFGIVPDTPPAPETLPMPVLLDVMAGLPVLEQWAKSVREYVYAALARGEDVAGWKLVSKRATRKWNDEEKVRDAMHALGYTKHEIDAPEKVKSPAQMEKMAKQLKGEPVPEELWNKLSSGYTLAADNDPRPAALLGPAGFTAEPKPEE